MSDWSPALQALDGIELSSSERTPLKRHRHRRYRATPVGAATVRSPVTVDVAHLSWQLEASCRGTDTEGFFPIGAPDPAILKLCAACPVAKQCLEFAVANPNLAGIWAGTSDKERQRMRRKSRRAVPAPAG